VDVRLVSKSIEAFVMAIEIYNKPTLCYRVEGFSFFICNAWELMLKAYLIKISGEETIYYSDNPERTISLENCVEKVFTNKKDPLRINLEKIIELRNTSTHFITNDYELIYAPLFQSCVLNLSNKLLEFFNIDISTVIPNNFLTLSINMHPFDTNEIRAKYPPAVSMKLLKTNDDIAALKKENTNPSFAIQINHEYYITKNQDKADCKFAISSDSDEKLKLLKVLKDPNETHKYKANGCVKEINRRIKRDKMPFESLSVDPVKKNIFNTYHFGLFTTYYQLKENQKYCYKYKPADDLNDNVMFSYSMAIIDFIYDEIKKDPENIIQNLKNCIKKIS
jgi:hypothetical protein